MTIIRVLDMETTGLPSEDGTGEKHGMMQIGWTDYDTETKRIPVPHDEFVNPGRPTSIEARAVHHISDEDVKDGISPTDACQVLMGIKPRPLFNDHAESAEGVPDYFCAHNIDLERAFFGGGEIPWLCTYKSALRVWPTAPGHKLQELRYWLNIDASEDFLSDYAAYPHRAPDDAYICAFVLRRMIAEMMTLGEFKTEEAAIAKMVRWSSGPALLYMCFMKKHKGKPWAKVAEEDADYLLWIWEKSDVKDRDILATVRYHLQQKGLLKLPSSSPAKEQTNEA